MSIFEEVKYGCDFLLDCGIRVIIPPKKILDEEIPPWYNKLI